MEPTGECGEGSPMVSEDGVLVQYNLLQQFNEFIGKIRGHEGLHSDRHVVWVGCLIESCLHHLRNRMQGGRDEVRRERWREGGGGRGGRKERKHCVA